MRRLAQSYPFLDQILKDLGHLWLSSPLSTDHFFCPLQTPETFHPIILCTYFIYDTETHVPFHYLFLYPILDSLKRIGTDNNHSDPRPQ